METLDPLDQGRKCFRMVNGVLLELTVKDVIPALRTNSEGLKKVLDELVKQYKNQQSDMEKWKVRHFTTAQYHFKGYTSDLDCQQGSQRKPGLLILLSKIRHGITYKSSNSSATSNTQCIRSYSIIKQTIRKRLEAHCITCC